MSASAPATGPRSTGRRRPPARSSASSMLSVDAASVPPPALPRNRRRPRGGLVGPARAPGRARRPRPAPSPRVRLELMRWTGMRPSQMRRLTGRTSTSTTRFRTSAPPAENAVARPPCRRGHGRTRFHRQQRVRRLVDTECEPGHPHGRSGRRTSPLYAVSHPPRHSFATWYHPAADLADIQDLYGHTDLTTTPTIYAAPTPSSSAPPSAAHMSWPKRDTGPQGGPARRANGRQWGIVPTTITTWSHPPRPPQRPLCQPLQLVCLPVPAWQYFGDVS